MCANVPGVGRAEDSLWESVLSFTMGGLEVRLRFDGTCPDPRNHHTGPPNHPYSKEI